MKSHPASFYCITLLFILCLSAFAGCSMEQDKAKVTQPATKSVAVVRPVLATIADGEKPPQPIPGHEPDTVLQGQTDSFKVVFSQTGQGVAYLASKGDKVYVVHNQVRGKEYVTVGTVVLNSDGRRIAYAAVEAGKARIVVDGKEGKPYDTILSPVFSPDGQHVVYQAKEGDKWYVVVDNKQNAGTIASYSTPEFSADSNKIAFVEYAASNDKMRLIICDLNFSKQHEILSIGDQIFTTSKDKTTIAAVQVVKNKYRVLYFKFSSPDAVNKGPLYNVIENLILSDDGESLSYCALKGRTRLIILDNKNELLPVGGAPELPVIRPDKRVVGIFLAEQNRVSLHQSFLGSNKKDIAYDEVTHLSYSKDGSYVFAARNGNTWFIVVNGIEGPAFERVIEPKFSPDGTFVVYRARKDNNRFVVLADKFAKTVRQYPAYEQVHDVKFADDGKSVVYGVKDGKRLAWIVEKL